MTVRPMARCVVGRVADIPPGSCRVVSLEGESVGVFNVRGTFYAMRNLCPHQGGPLCLGRVTGTTEATDPSAMRWVRVGEIVRCPWHNWEFDILTGRSLSNPNRRVKTYDVHLEEDAGDWLVVVER